MDEWDVPLVGVEAHDTEELSGEIKSAPIINWTPAGDISIPITKSGAFIKFEYLGKSVETQLKRIKKIENYFTLRSKTITGVLKQLKCCSVDKNKKRMIVPRYGLFEILTEKYGLANYTAVSQITSGDKPSKRFKWQGKQTNNQKLIATEIMTNYFNPERVKLGSAGVILNLEAGQGKSYLAAYLMSVLNKKTAIILHTTALIDQWTKVLTNVFGDSISIGHYHSKKKSPGDVMIFIIDSASNDEFKIGGEVIKCIEFYNRFGLIILDECHMYSSKTALKALKAAQAPYMLGLSATPDEHADGYDRAVWWSIGPILDASTIPGYVATSEEFSAEVHRVMYYGPSSHTRMILNRVTEMTSSAETINMLCDDDIRTQVVVDCVRAGLKKNLYMFVFADRREYLTKLQEMLSEQESITGEIVESDDDFVRIVGGAKSTDLENAEVKSKVIFTTYSYMGTGKSVIKMNGLVLATPRKSKMKQYINRIFRLGSDATVKRHIWDLCDMKLKLSSQWSVRHAYYKSKNYTVVQEKIKYSDVDTGNLTVSKKDKEGDEDNEDENNEDEDEDNEDEDNEDIDEDIDNEEDGKDNTVPTAKSVTTSTAKSTVKTTVKSTVKPTVKSTVKPTVKLAKVKKLDEKKIGSIVSNLLASLSKK